MKNIHELLEELKACKIAQEWASTRTWEQIYNECYRGDWLCWLFVRTNPEDLQLLTLVKGHQANILRHLMFTPESLASVDAAIAFGEGKITEEEFKKVTPINPFDSYITYAVYAACTSIYYFDTPRPTIYGNKEIQQQTADIFRKFISIDKFNL